MAARSSGQTAGDSAGEATPHRPRPRSARGRVTHQRRRSAEPRSPSLGGAAGTSARGRGGRSRARPAAATGFSRDAARPRAPPRHRPLTSYIPPLIQSQSSWTPTIQSQANFPPRRASPPLSTNERAPHLSASLAACRGSGWRGGSRAAPAVSGAVVGRPAGSPCRPRPLHGSGANSSYLNLTSLAAKSCGGQRPAS